MRPKPARHRPRITETRGRAFSEESRRCGPRIWEPANARQHPFSASRNRRDARPAASSSDRPRPRPPRPRSSPAGAGGSADRPGRHVPSWRLREPEPRPAQTREPRRGGRRRRAFSRTRFFTGVAVRGERRAAAQVSAASFAPHALDRDGGVRAHEVRQAAPPQGRRRRREQGPAGSRRGGGGAPWGRRRGAFGAGEPADGAGADGSDGVFGSGDDGGGGGGSNWGDGGGGGGGDGARRDQPLDRRRVRSRGGNLMWAWHAACASRWLGRCSTRSTPRWPSTGGERRIPRRRRRWSRRWPPRRSPRRVLGGARAARRRARRRLPGVHRVRARAQAAAQAVHVGVNAPSRPSGLFRTTRRTRLDGRAFVVIYFCSYCTPTVYSYRVFTPCAR